MVVICVCAALSGYDSPHIMVFLIVTILGHEFHILNSSRSLELPEINVRYRII